MVLPYENYDMAVRLSYIVPVFNVERYLGQCLDSILSTTISNNDYEIICVNDGSTDKSTDILRNYQRLYSNIFVVEFRENRGLSAARNAGVRFAKGDYIWFVDSDDFIVNKAVASLLTMAECNNVDVLLFNYYDYSSDKGIECEQKIFTDTKVMNGQRFVETQFGDSFVYYIGYVWRFLLRREYIKQNGFYFPEGQYWEDTVYFPRAILYADRIMSSTIFGYYYRTNPTSISGGKSKSWSCRKIFDYCFRAGWALYRFGNEIESKNPHFATIFRRFAIYHYIMTFPSKLAKKMNITLQNIFHSLCTNN